MKKTRMGLTIDHNSREVLKKYIPNVSGMVEDIAEKAVELDKDFDNIWKDITQKGIDAGLNKCRICNVVKDVDNMLVLWHKEKNPNDEGILFLCKKCYDTEQDDLNNESFREIVDFTNLNTSPNERFVVVSFPTLTKSMAKGEIENRLMKEKDKALQELKMPKGV